MEDLTYDERDKTTELAMGHLGLENGMIFAQFNNWYPNKKCANFCQ